MIPSAEKARTQFHHRRARGHTRVGWSLRTQKARAFLVGCRARAPFVPWCRGLGLRALRTIRDLSRKTNQRSHEQFLPARLEACGVYNVRCGLRIAAKESYENPGGLSRKIPAHLQGDRNHVSLAKSEFARTTSQLGSGIGLFSCPTSPFRHRGGDARPVDAGPGVCGPRDS